MTLRWTQIGTMPVSSSAIEIEDQAWWKQIRPPGSGECMAGSFLQLQGEYLERIPEALRSLSSTQYNT